MKRTVLNMALLALAAPLFGQQTAPAQAPAKEASSPVVAVVNGESITREQFDSLWGRLNGGVRQRYEQQFAMTGGGRKGFLDNYLGKVLVVQEARRQGFDANPSIREEIDAARETALFAAYVRDVASKTVKNDAQLQEFYKQKLPDLTERQAKASAELTPEKLDHLWQSMSMRIRQQYEQTGAGRTAFRAHQIEKRLMLDIARNESFDKKPAVIAEMDAARESALFDAYVREVIAADVVTEEMLQQFYDENLPDFTRQEAKLRLLRVAKGNRPADAREKVGRIMTDLLDARTKLAADGRHVRELKDVFGKLAQVASEDPSAEQGGDLGWVRRGALPEKLDAAAFTMPVETVSGIIELDDSFALLYLEERQNRTESFADARAAIREYLIGRESKAIIGAVTAATAELRAAAKIEVRAQNLQ